MPGESDPDPDAKGSAKTLPFTTFLSADSLKTTLPSQGIVRKQYFHDPAVCEAFAFGFIGFPAQGREGYMYIYIYAYIYVCVYLYEYVYIYRVQANPSVLGVHF